MSLATCLLAPALRAEEQLLCGVPITADLASAAEDDYRVSSSANAVAVVDVVDVSGSIDVLRLETGERETCSGSLLWRLEASDEIHVSDCFGHDSGSYTIETNVVSQGPDNCAQPMPCGTYPYVRNLLVPGQVDSYSFVGMAGERINVRATGTETTGAMRVRLFEPDGTPVPGGDSCSGSMYTNLRASGTYTALISACGLPKAGLYLLAFQSPACPSGPEMTHMGIAQADGTPLAPASYDELGRPVYVRAVLSGSGFFLVFEARPGSSGADVGVSAYEPGALPDLQALVSRPLGDGSLTVCDKERPHIGGVPAVPTLEFDSNAAVVNAINDFGCRFDNGAGQPEGVSSENACTSFENGDFHFVEHSSTLQYCMLVSSAWQFPLGQTIVKARARDDDGNLGEPREMIVQVGAATPAPATPTPTPEPYCAGDCNTDSEVTVNELVIGVNILLGTDFVSSCEPMDVNGDSVVTVDELIVAVRHVLDGCA